MINSTAFRLCIVVALMLFAYGGARLVKAGLEPPTVDLPDWTFRELPLQLGPWHGHKTELDPEIAKATGASIIVDRLYEDEAGHSISLHTAMFKNPNDAVCHTPINCYRANGYQDTSAVHENVEASDSLTIPVSLTTWERKGEQLMVVYWYQLGEHILFDKWDLGFKVRWSLRGRAKWPALVKVMLQINASNPEDARTAVLSFAKQVAAWENQPKHRFETLDKASHPTSD
jgi:EpsI family protein